MQFQITDKKIIKDVETCSYCMKMCRFACPIVEASKNEKYTPFAKMNQYLHYIDSKRNISIDKIDSKKITEHNSDLYEVPWYCIHCGLCQTHCSHDISIEFNLSKIRNLFIENENYSSLLNKNLREKIVSIKENYELKYKDIPEIIEREFKKDLISIDSLIEKTIYIPDYDLLLSNPKLSVKIFENIKRRIPDLKVLEGVYLSPFRFYSLGFFKKAEEIYNQLNQISDNTKIIFENEEMFYAYSHLSKQMNWKQAEDYFLLYNKINFDLPEKSFQFQSTPFSLRLNSQDFVTKINQFKSCKEATPGKDAQSTLPDFYFQYIDKKVYKKMLDTKIKELIDFDTENDIVCSSYQDFLSLKENNFKRRVKYLCEFID